MSSIKFDSKRWCMALSKQYSYRGEFDVASTLRSVAEEIDNLRADKANLVDAVAWERECDECGEWLHGAWWDRNELDLEEIEDLYDCARAEVVRLLEDRTTDAPPK